MRSETMLSPSNSVYSGTSLRVMSILYLIDTSSLAPNIQHVRLEASFCMVFQLSAKGPLPSQKQFLTVSEKKSQLIHIIVEALLAEAVVPGRYSSRLIITGKEPTPIEIVPCGVVIRREDIKATHEEADRPSMRQRKRTSM